MASGVVRFNPDPDDRLAREGTPVRLSSELRLQDDCRMTAGGTAEGTATAMRPAAPLTSFSSSQFASLQFSVVSSQSSDFTSQSSVLGLQFPIQRFTGPRPQRLAASAVTNHFVVDPAVIPPSSCSAVSLFPPQVPAPRLT